MTAVRFTHCRGCGQPLTDRFSRMVGWGPKCRKGMTPEQLVAAVRSNQPGYVPSGEPAAPSAAARRNRAEVAAVTAPIPAPKPAAEPERPSTAPAAEPAESMAGRCGHGALRGACGICRRANDPRYAADRILAETLRRPMAERLDAERAAARRLLAAYLPVGQTTIGDPS